MSLGIALHMHIVMLFIAHTLSLLRKTHIHTYPCFITFRFPNSLFQSLSPLRCQGFQGRCHWCYVFSSVPFI